MNLVSRHNKRNTGDGTAAQSLTTPPSPPGEGGRGGRGFFLFLLLFLPLLTQAQVIVTARLDTANILIGEQVDLTVRCTAGSRQNIVLPLFQPGDTLVTGVEVVANGRVDSTFANGGQRLTLTRRYRITSFDSAVYALPPFAVQVDGKVYRSNGTVGLKVNTVAVDTTHVENFRGPHTVVNEPFAWTWRLSLLAFLAAFLLVGALAALARLSDPRLITRRVIIFPPKPAHETALQNINRIQREREPDAKSYYMQLTDALRTYLHDRFGFNACEMTTAEIIDELYASGNEEALAELRTVLQTADLVKFARHEAPLSEQDRHLAEAMDYVQSTKLVPLEQPKPRIEYVTLSNRYQRLWRGVLYVFAPIALVAAFGLAAYLLFELWFCGLIL